MAGYRDVRVTGCTSTVAGERDRPASGIDGGGLNRARGTNRAGRPPTGRPAVPTVAAGAQRVGLVRTRPNLGLIIVLYARPAPEAAQQSEPMTPETSPLETIA
jgi:hypothetical protein